MAYMNQEHKTRIKAQLDPIMKEHRLKYSLAVRNHSTIVCTVKSGPIDFIQDYNKVIANRSGISGLGEIAKGYIDVNPYWYHEHFTGKALEIVTKIMQALNVDNYDNSQPQFDYFDRGHYVDLNIGSWDKPYQITA